MSEKTTEQPSNYRHLENMGVRELVENINREDQTVPVAVAQELTSITALIEAALPKLQNGGRLFYLGSGTSGRLGIVDASECPPTYGVPHGLVIGLIAGGDAAIRKAQEFAEDNFDRGWEDLQKENVSSRDFVIGITASGTTPYVVGALKNCRENGISTGSISCNRKAAVSAFADFAIEVVVGPEFVTGSTRMKAGTAQKLVLNLISTALMVKLGRVKDNKMVDMHLSNQKLIDRGSKMISELFNLEYLKAKDLLLEHGSVRSVINKLTEGQD